MKKILVSLLVLAMVAPAMAAVTFDVQQVVGEEKAVITMDTGGDVVRGVALKVICTNGAKLVDLSYTANAEFNTFIDYFAVNGTGSVTGDTPDQEGHPYALAGTTAGVAAIDDTTFVVSMGVLDETENQGGYTGSGDLIVINTGAGDVCIELDTVRGGVVGDVALTSNLDGGAQDCVTILPAGNACYAALTTAEQTAWDAYIAGGKTEAQMEAWCNQFQCRGDADNAAYLPGILDWQIYSADLNMMIAQWQKTYITNTNPAADFDHAAYLPGILNWTVYSADLNILIANWQKTPATLVVCPSYLP